MASKFQSRLVGTIIFVAVGVIVLPDVLDGQKLHYKEEFASVPIKPALDSDVENYQVLDPVEDKKQLPETPVSAVIDSSDNSDIDNHPQPVIKPTKKLTKAKKPVHHVAVKVHSVAEVNHYQDSAWILQLMALKNKDNAKKLASDLRKRGYDAHTKSDNGFIRVFIGPNVSKTKLERQVSELKKITGSKGQLLKFKPLNP